MSRMPRHRADEPTERAQDPQTDEMGQTVMRTIPALRELITSLRNIALEQRITNLIVLSQITLDPDEKKRLVEDALVRLRTHDPDTCESTSDLG